jgi:hypothetical protein
MFWRGGSSQPPSPSTCGSVRDGREAGSSSGGWPFHAVRQVWEDVRGASGGWGCCAVVGELCRVPRGDRWCWAAGVDAAAPVSGWTEAEGRAAVLERSWGRCELCGRAAPEAWAHRVARSHLGAWCPLNGLALCEGPEGCHPWTHRNPGLARAGGWIVPGWGDPRAVPVWLRRPEGAGWWQLRVDRGGWHESRLLDLRVVVRLGLPVVPVLPVWAGLGWAA